MKTAAVKLVQQELKKEGFRPGPVDGKLGSRTYNAIDKALKKRGTKIPTGWETWSQKRRAVAYLQSICREQGLEVGPVDGYWGPQTDFAADVFAHIVATGSPPAPWRDTPSAPVNPNHWPADDETALRQYYGGPNTEQVMLTLPYPHRLSWNLNQTIQRFSCHRKVRDSLSRVLTNVLSHYGLEQIKDLRLDRWGGCLNVRPMRGGTRMSTHAWGIAVDYDPERNALQWGRDRAVFARPEYDAWWQIWESEGWVSLGRARNFDWMHIQAATL